MKLVSSVGLVLFDPEGRILVLKELESKPHYGKMAGMLSVPIETVEDGENNDQALVRLVDEEVGVPIDGTLSFFQELRVRLNNSYTERMYIYKGVCRLAFVAKPKDTDVQFFGWMLPQRILELPKEQRRLEVDPVVKLFHRQ